MSSSDPARFQGRLGMFLRSAVFDYVLVLVVSVALVFTVSFGFNSAPDLRGNIGFITAICAVLLVPLYAGGWSKRAVPIAGVAYAVLAVAAIFAVGSLSGVSADLFVDGQVNDVAENYAVFGIVCAVVPVLVYLLSRRTWGVVLLFFLGAIACGAIQFLYREWIETDAGTVSAIVAYVGIGALFMVQGYRQGVMKSRIVKRTSFFGSFAFGILGSALCMAVGVAVFFGIVSGLGITTVNAKPFEEYFMRPVVEYHGTYQQKPVYDPNTATSNLSDEVDYTSDDEYGTETDGEADSTETSEVEEQEEEQSAGNSFISAIASALNMDDWDETFDAERFELPPSLIGLLCLVPLAIIALIVWLRYHQRVRRLRKIEQQPLPERVALLYNFFMRGFKRLKIDKPDSATPLEFALSSAGELAGFMRNDSQADLLGITLIYQRAVYGAGNVTEADYQYVRDYYQSFFKNAHARMGHPRWIFRGFWRI